MSLRQYPYIFTTSEIYHMTSDNPNSSPAGGEGLDVSAGPQGEHEKLQEWPHPPYPVYHPGYYPHPFQMASALYGGGSPDGGMYPGGYGYFPGESNSTAFPRNYKTVICRHFLRGHCMRGTSCGFRHYEEEPMPEPPRRPKSSVNCRRWTQLGDCHLGDRCGFRHDENFCPTDDFPPTYPHLTNDS